MDRVAMRDLQRTLLEVIPADDDGNPQVITIAGHEIPCARSLLGTEKQIAVVGEFGSTAFPVRVVLQDLIDAGVELYEMEEATFQGTVYQILRHERDSMENSALLILGDRYA